MKTDFYEQLSKDMRVKNFSRVDNECGFYGLCKSLLVKNNINIKIRIVYDTVLNVFQQWRNRGILL